MCKCANGLFHMALGAAIGFCVAKYGKVAWKMIQSGIHVASLEDLMKAYEDDVIDTDTDEVEEQENKDGLTSIEIDEVDDEISD